MAEPTKHASLHRLFILLRRVAVNLDGREVREQNFIVTLLFRHCQARMGMEKLEAFAGKPPDNPDECLIEFRKIATELEGLAATDETFVVNALQQAFQWRAAHEVDQLMVLSKASVQ